MKDFRRGEPTGWCCGDTKAMLKRIIDEINPKNIAEIGSFKGMSAYFMCKNSNAHIYCIDHWKGSKEHQEIEGIENLYQTFLDNTDIYRDRITTIKHCSEQGLPKLKELCPDVDMVFIDGDHSYKAVRYDIIKTMELFPNAVICGDDFTHETVRDAVKSIKRSYSTINDRSWRLI